MEIVRELLQRREIDFIHAIAFLYVIRLLCEKETLDIQLRIAARVVILAEFFEQRLDIRVIVKSVVEFTLLRDK